MLILVIDPSALNLDFCLRSIHAGHTVKWYTKGSRSSHIGQGLVDKIDNWKRYVDVADLIFSADNLEHMDEIQTLIDKGYPVFGPGKKAAKLELDRMYGQKVVEEFGGPTIPSHEFKNFDAAIKFIKENPKRYVCKPCGEEEDKTLSYVAKDEADLIGFLTKRKEKGGTPYFILQEFKKGTEIAVTGIFGPGGWMDFWAEGWEFKKQMNDDLGVNTGEMGTVIRYTKQSKLADILMKPMAETLHKIGYVGMLDMNCIIDEKDGTPWPMEWTARPGYPMWNIQQPLHKNEDPAQWILDCVNGKNTLEVEEKTCVGVVMANSDFPFNKNEEESYLDFPILTDDVTRIDNLHPCEIKLTKTVKMMGENLVEDVPEWGTAGSYILVCTGVGDSMTEAKEKAYEIVKQVRLGNDPQYRTDIGNRCEKGLKAIQKFGYCKGWKF